MIGRGTVELGVPKRIVEWAVKATALDAITERDGT
jgi:hypothetical protein